MFACAQTYAFVCLCVRARADLPTGFFFVNFKMFKQSVSKTIDTYTHSTQEMNTNPIKKKLYTPNKQTKCLVFLPVDRTELKMKEGK